MLNRNKSPPEGRKGMFVTASLDLNKANISVVPSGNSRTNFPSFGSRAAGAILNQTLVINMYFTFYPKDLQWL